MANYNEIPSLEARLKDLERRMSTAETAPRLTASGVGSGGIKISEGGTLTIVDGGGIEINNEGNLTIRDGGDLNVIGGNITSWTTDLTGYVSLVNGSLLFRRIVAEEPGRLRTESVGGRTVLRLTPPTQDPIPAGSDFTTLYLEGKSSANAGMIVIRSEGQITTSADGSITNTTLSTISNRSTGTTFNSSEANIQSTSTGSIFNNSGSIIQNVSTGGIFNAPGGTFQAISGADVNLSAQTGLNVRNVNADWLFGGANNYLWHSGTGQVYLNSVGQMTARTPTFYVQGNLGCSGTKPFKIVHPLDPSKALVHAATESPVAGLEYWGESVIGGDGITVIDLPDYFEALAAADWRGVYVTPYGAPVLIAASKIDNGTFTVTGPPGTEFSWLAKGRRGDADGQFEVEPDRVESGIDADLVPPEYVPTETMIEPPPAPPFS